MNAGVAGRPLRVLIVDDDPDVRTLHARYVAEAEGFAVVGEVGQPAQVVAAAGLADLVLLDVNLPGFSGVEVLRRLRSAYGDSVDVIVISSSRDRITVRQAVSARVVDYLAKPFAKGALLARLDEYRRTRLAQPEASRSAEPPLAQGEIDALLAPAPAPGAVRGAGHPLPKGIAPATLDAVRGVLDGVRAIGASEVAQLTGTSPVTARRYLEFLSSTGEADVSHRYGRRGRPELLYRRAPTR